MPLSLPFKLEKLTIRAYRTRLRSRGGRPVGEFEAMFNPAGFEQNHAIQYGRRQGYNSSGKEVNYSYSKPSELKFKLVLDGTGVETIGLSRLGGLKTVSARVKEFLQLTHQMDGKEHEPHYLSIEWGDLHFNCRLASVKVTYQRFDRDGSALRAELDVAFLSDEEVGKRKLLENKSSPDLSHRRVVRQGDTLPLLTREIYGSSSHYLFVARANALDDFRNLEPGLELVFPPLEQPTHPTITP